MSKRANVGVVFTGVLLIIMLAACDGGGGGGGSVEMTLESCGGDAAIGFVKNTSDHELDTVKIGVDFFDKKGDWIPSELGWADVRWLKPGQTQQWWVYYYGVPDYDTCMAEVIHTGEPWPWPIGDPEQGGVHHESPGPN